MNFQLFASGLVVVLTIFLLHSVTQKMCFVNNGLADKTSTEPGLPQDDSNALRESSGTLFQQRMIRTNVLDDKQICANHLESFSTDRLLSQQDVTRTYRQPASAMHIDVKLWSYLVVTKVHRVKLGRATTQSLDAILTRSMATMKIVRESLKGLKYHENFKAEQSYVFQYVMKTSAHDRITAQTTGQSQRYCHRRACMYDLALLCRVW